jgi:glycosyltransferase involved in cell wall biosynthesis
VDIAKTGVLQSPGEPAAAAERRVGRHMSLDRICPVIIVRDAERTIARTLESLAAFNQVVVFDNGSQDRTIEVCAAFPNTHVVKGEFSGFGPTKNRAAALAAGEWILSIDADEYLSDALATSLAGLVLDDERSVFAVERRNLFMGKHVRRGGWGNDWLVRLYNRRVCAFDDAPVHEKVVVPADVRVLRLTGPLWHQAVIELDQFLQKISRYSELRRSARGPVHSPAVIAVRSGWAFFRSYFLQLGVLEGWRGLVIAAANGTGTFFRHMKRFVDSRHAASRTRGGAS